jgi:hypothetical protein
VKKALIGIFALATSFASAQIPSSELRLWLKADDITLPDNAQVTSWSDATGGGDFLISGPGAPIFKVNGCPGYLNGKPYVSWDTGTTPSVMYRNDIAGLASMGPRTMIAVYRLFNTSARSFVLDVNEAGSNMISYGFDANTWMTSGNKFGFYAENNSYDSNTPTDYQFHVQYVTSNTMTPGADVAADSEYRIDNNIQTLNFRSGSGGYLNASTSNQIYFGGYVEMSEIIIYNRVLSATERDGINSYLATKYGSFPMVPLSSLVPTVTSFTPDSAPSGTSVTITGTNFTATSDVSFNGKPATSFTVNSSTSITATVPPGVTPGPVQVTAVCNTATSANNFSPPYTPSGNTITCNGSTDYVIIPDNPSLRATSLTLSTWVKFTSLPPFAPLITKPLGTAINDSYALWYESGTIRGTVEDVAGLNTPIQFTWTPALNEWYHVAFTFDDASKVQTLYLNGAKVGSLTNSTGAQYDASSVLIAADLDNGITTKSPVIIDEVRIWNNAISRSQLLATMSSALTGNEAGLVAYYKMDETGQGSDIVVKNSATTTGTVLNGLTVGTCTTPVFTVMLPATITGFTPAGAAVGAVVTITGTDFSTVPSKNIVEFNGVTATVIASTSTSITTTVPISATAGPITITICTNTATSSSNFSVCVVPSAPGVTNASRCETGTVVLSATGGANGQYRWYNVPTGGTAIAGAVNNNYTTPSISATTTYYVSIVNGYCESARIPVVGEVKSCSPVINDDTEQAPAGGKASVNVIPLVSTVVGSLDISSITIVSQPVSGAKATIKDGVVTIDYAGVSFVGEDHFTVRACDDVGDCSEKEFTIEISGKLTVYNALSKSRDGKNDIFFIESIDVIPDAKQNKVTIINRWGDVVFEVEDYDNKTRVFTGMNKSGNPVPAGIYFYKIEFVSGREMMDGWMEVR